MPKQICKKDHSKTVRVLENSDQIAESQAVIRGRHLCPCCAYEKGFEDGRRAAQVPPAAPAPPALG
jgi:hypothetical protein